jgi:Putative Actinobacterial Holin-X, holin superfamily III
MTETRDKTAHDGHQPTAELVRQATEQMSRLVRDELALARTEMTAKGKRAGMGAGMLGTAGVTALFGVAALLVTIGLALDRVMPNWLAAFIVAAALLALAGLMAVAGRGAVKRAGPAVPKETMTTVREDIDELKRRAHR